MSLNTGLGNYEPLLQQTRSQKIRKDAIIVVAAVALVAVCSQLLFGQSNDQDFLGAKNQVSMVASQQTLDYPGYYYVNVFAEQRYIVGLSYKFNKNYNIVYNLRAYNRERGNWDDLDMKDFITEMKVNSDEKKIVINQKQDKEQFNTKIHELYVENTDGRSYTVTDVQDAALDSDGKVYAIVQKNISQYDSQFQSETKGFQLYSSQDYRNVEVYQDEIVLVRANGTLEGYNEICVKDISASALDENALFALACPEDPNQTLSQVLRWNDYEETWEKVDDVFAEKIAVVSNTKIYVLVYYTITEITLNE
ncbi:UNKNOWN [Stylonychia lemnae]|uniref:Uncharacterized protein n=1 Tax=Stylonychia lemnae TaxID=5949 RepID=A0A078B7P8_STYLE|nr:UNKNOWN [Stylonychia lemnae]|eukprot:CDW90535.1 UNKNOWN [Stylonychia lemnae]